MDRGIFVSTGRGSTGFGRYSLRTFLLTLVAGAAALWVPRAVGQVYPVAVCAEYLTGTAGSAYYPSLERGTGATDALGSQGGASGGAEAMGAVGRLERVDRRDLR